MATVLWADIHSLVLPDVPGCPTPTIDVALAASAADFCARSHIWREELDPEIVISGIADYELSPNTTGAVLESVLWANLDGQPLEHVDARYVEKSKLDDTGKPTSFWLINDTTVRLLPIPDDRYDLTTAISVKPSRAATGVEDWIYESYVEPIVSGAIWRLARTPGKAWSDPEIAMYHHRMFEVGITQAKVRDHRNTILRVANRSF